MRISDWSSDVCSSDLFAFINQGASGNDSTVLQTGEATVANVSQTGSGNSSELNQSGFVANFNLSTGVRQSGDDNQSVVNQTGSATLDGDLDRKSTRLNSSH